MTKELPSEKDLRKFLEHKLKTSGFSFENKVGQILKKNKFYVDREVPFLDKENQQSGRRIDFVANDGIVVDRYGIGKTTIRMGELKLIIECKSNPNYSWIFYEGEHHEYSQSEEMYFKNPKPSDYKFLPKPYIEKIFYASSYSEIIFPIEKREKPHTSPEKIFESIAQVTKATRYQMDLQIKTIEKLKQRGFSDIDALPTWDFIIFQPVIVFGGNLYKIDDTNENLEQLDFVQIDKSWLSTKYDEVFGQIHIVSFNALQKYIDVLKDNYNLTHNSKEFTNKEYNEFQRVIKEKVEKLSKKKKWNIFS